jgi:hypothetical protein
MKAALFVCLTALCACDQSKSTDPIVCDSILRVGLAITAFDAGTNTVISANGTAIAREGSFVDSASNIPSHSPSFALAFGRPGTYSVRVNVGGYAPWQLDRVVVSSDQCGVITLPLAVKLLPLS